MRLSHKIGEREDLYPLPPPLDKTEDRQLGCGIVLNSRSDPPKTDKPLKPASTERKETPENSRSESP